MSTCKREKSQLLQENRMTHRNQQRQEHPTDDNSGSTPRKFLQRNIEILDFTKAHRYNTGGTPWNLALLPVLKLSRKSLGLQNNEQFQMSDAVTRGKE